MNNDRFLVSVCVFTHNHEKYIAQCLESILMQRTSFKYEIIIGEDYSKDNTRRICESFKAMYPQNITLLDRGKNLGICENMFDTLKNASGEYLALIDGDDYWIHPFKLQNQFEYLEANREINMVFHQTIRINELTKAIDLFVKDEKSIYKFDDILDKWIIATGAMFFRKEAMDYPEFLLHTHNFDLAIQLIVNRNCKEIGFLKDIMSVYRINSGSNTYSPNYDSLNTWKRLKLLFEEFDEYSSHKYSEKIEAKITELNDYLDHYNQFNFKQEFKLFAKKILGFIGYKVTISKV